jgi:hypothetical protein
VIDDARNPDSPICGGWKVGQNRRVLDRDLLLVVIAIRNPSLNLGAIECSGDEPLVEGVLVMIALVANGMEPGDEAGGGRRDPSLELRVAYGRREVRSHLGAERTLLKVGAFPAGTCNLLHEISSVRAIVYISRGEAYIGISSHERVFAYDSRRRINSLGIRIRSANRRNASSLTCHQVMSISNHRKP